MAGKKVNCGKCRKDIGKSGSVQCDECLDWLHLACAEVNDAIIKFNKGHFFNIF